MKNKLGNISNRRVRGLFARAILDENISIEVRGDCRRTQAVHTILEASRHLFRILQMRETSIEDIQEALGRKHDAAIQYQKLFNTSWYF